jgi:hypothetical protein
LTECSTLERVWSGADSRAYKILAPPPIRFAFVATVEIYEIRPTGEGKRRVLSGTLGIVDSLEIDTIREAALHAQFCAGAREAISERSKRTAH